MGCQLLASNVQQDLDLTNVRPKTSCCLFLFLMQLYDFFFDFFFFLVIWNTYTKKEENRPARLGLQRYEITFPV